MELYFKDLKYLCDCVNNLGAKPWIWSSPVYDHPEMFKKYISPDEVIINPYNYNALVPEHYTPIESRAEYVTYYNEDKYKEMGIKFVEEDPYLVNFRNITPDVIKKGYKLIPCASVYNRCDWNTYDLVEYFHDLCPDEQLLGFMSAPWGRTLPTERQIRYYEETFRFLKEAKEAFYG